MSRFTKFWRDTERRWALIDLIGLGSVLFGKGKRGNMIASIMAKAEMLPDFKDARDLVDKAEASGDGVTLTVEQTAALDQFLDIARRPKRELKKLLK